MPGTRKQSVRGTPSVRGKIIFNNTKMSINSSKQDIDKLFGFFI
jgi:hypothetical protein